jgi:hypothetical protein
MAIDVFGDKIEEKEEYVEDFPVIGIFDYIKTINTKTGQLAVDDKSYVPFVVDRAFSHYPDTLEFANKMNVRMGIDMNLHYDYYYHSVPAKSRYKGWVKSDRDYNLDLVTEYYDVSEREAINMLELLSDEQIGELRKFLNKDGIE